MDMRKGITAQFELAIVLDISGSMGSHIAGTKAGVAGMLEQIQECIPQGESMAVSYSEFTERDAPVQVGNMKTGCFVDMKSFNLPEEGAAAVSHVNATTLSRPRSVDVVANGCDAEENLKAGLQALLQIRRNEDTTTLILLITDDGPHFFDDDGDTAIHEQRWLTQAGSKQPSDATAFLREFVSQWPTAENGSSQVILCPVYYGRKPLHLAYYGQMAHLTNGIILSPQGDIALTLAAALSGIVRETLCNLAEIPLSAEERNWMQWMTVYEPSECDVVCDADLKAYATTEGYAPRRIMSAAEVNAAIISSLGHVADNVRGGGWGKRAIAVEGLPYQLRCIFEALVVLQTPATDRDFTKLQAAVGLMHNKVEMNRSHVIGFTVESFQERLGVWDNTPAEADDVLAEDVSSVSMLSTFESLEELLAMLASLQERETNQAELVKLLKGVLGMLRGVCINVSLPPDAQGQPDFKNSWSAEVNGIDPSLISESEYIKLVLQHQEDTGEKGYMLGLTTRNKMNVFLPLVLGRVSQIVYNLLSSTQLLNAMVAIPFAGDFKFIPNLANGVTASMLWKLLSSVAMSEADTKLMWRIVATLRSVGVAPCKELREKLRQGTCEPESNPPKLMAGLLHFANPLEVGPRGDAALTLILRELLATQIQSYHGKNTPENRALYNARLRELLTNKDLEDAMRNQFGFEPVDTFDPLDAKVMQPHLLETIGDFGIGELPRKKIPKLVDCAVSILSEHLQKHKVVVNFMRVAKRIWSIVTGNESDTLEITNVWPEFERDMLLLFLLRFRPLRYEVQSTPDSQNVHVPQEVDLGNLIVQSYKEVFAEDLSRWHKIRKEAARNKCIQMTVDLILKGGKWTQGALVEALAVLCDTEERPQITTPKGDLRPVPPGPVVTCPTLFKLDREDVVDVLDKMKDSLPEGTVWNPVVLDTIVLGLSIGAWCPTPAVTLKAHLPKIEKLLSDSAINELSNSMVQQLCNVPADRCNRHGHNIELQYPGAAGWTEEYASKRLANASSRAAYLQRMKEFTLFVNNTLEIAGLTAHDKALIQKTANTVFDANQDADARKKINIIKAKYEDGVLTVPAASPAPLPAPAAAPEASPAKHEVRADLAAKTVRPIPDRIAQLEAQLGMHATGAATLLTRLAALEEELGVVAEGNLQERIAKMETLVG